MAATSQIAPQQQPAQGGRKKIKWGGCSNDMQEEWESFRRFSISPNQAKSMILSTPKPHAAATCGVDDCTTPLAIIPTWGVTSHLGFLDGYHIGRKEKASNEQDVRVTCGDMQQAFGLAQIKPKRWFSLYGSQKLQQPRNVAQDWGKTNTLLYEEQAI